MNKNPLYAAPLRGAIAEASAQFVSVVLQEKGADAASKCLQMIAWLDDLVLIEMVVIADRARYIAKQKAAAL